VIQNEEIRPVGETKTSKIDVRIISATNKDLSKAIARDEFREDLFYRINVLPLELPPLRERKNDIQLLINYFVKRESVRLGMDTKRFSREALHCLEDYPWPGNIRELENFVKYVLSTVDGRVIGINEIPDHIISHGDRGGVLSQKATADEGLMPSEPVLEESRAQSLFSGYSWQELERDYVIYLLEKNKWNVTRAAREAGVNRSTFDSRLRRLGVRKS
jgi:transcriptional regulator with GAF, ATPase, and Fis domain